MKTKRIIAASAAVLIISALGGAALAKTATRQAPKPTTATTLVADTDDVQQGDQTTPDTGTENGTERSGPGTEPAENGSESGQEQTGESDGPGGHADPAGNVNHQFEGEE